MRYIPATVYRPACGTDSTNGGISSQEHTVLVACENGTYSAEEALNSDRVILEVFKANKLWKSTPDSVYLQQAGDTRQLTFGGNFVYSSHQSFVEQYGNAPVKIHDHAINK